MTSRDDVTGISHGFTIHRTYAHHLQVGIGSVTLCLQPSTMKVIKTTKQNSMIMKAHGHPIEAGDRQ